MLYELCQLSGVWCLSVGMIQTVTYKINMIQTVTNKLSMIQTVTYVDADYKVVFTFMTLLGITV